MSTSFASPSLIKYSARDCWEGLFKHHLTVLLSVQTNARAIWRTSPEPPALPRILILLCLRTWLVIWCSFVCSFNYKLSAVINTLCVLYWEAGFCLWFCGCSFEYLVRLISFRVAYAFVPLLLAFSVRNGCCSRSVRLYTHNKWRAAERIFMKCNIGEFFLTFMKSFISDQPTYELSPCSRALLEKLTGPQLVKKFPAFYGTRRFVTACTRACHLSLSRSTSIF
jgi:hypothetical protein